MIRQARAEAWELKCSDNNNVLLKLDISNCHRGMSDDVALAIVDCLKNNTTLQEVTI